MSQRWESSFPFFLNAIGNKGHCSLQLSWKLFLLCVCALFGQQEGGKELEGDIWPLMACCACFMFSQRISLPAHVWWEEGAGLAGRGLRCRRVALQCSPTLWHRGLATSRLSRGKMCISEAQQESFHQLELGLDQPPEKAGIRSH